MRKLLYFLGAITGITLVVAACKRAERNDLYEESRQMRLKQINGQPPDVWEY